MACVEGVERRGVEGTAVDRDVGVVGVDLKWTRYVVVPAGWRFVPPSRLLHVSLSIPPFFAFPNGLARLGSGVLPDPRQLFVVFVETAADTCFHPKGLYCSAFLAYVWVGFALVLVLMVCLSSSCCRF